MEWVLVILVVALLGWGITAWVALLKHRELWENYKEMDGARKRLDKMLTEAKKKTIRFGV
ncbi:MAG: hypothetical protein GY832_22270 [Chloroflexi bacterium]|nr:hypothetical protein [Chloroflexota bacterium]